MPVGWVETAEFQNLGFFMKSLYFSAWVKIILAKYISAWLFAEGAVILSGLGYNGRWEDGSVKWNGGANVRLRIFEKSTRFQHLIEGFNINTNAWVMSYVYKRLRFLNNRMASQFGALVSVLFEYLEINFLTKLYLAIFGCMARLAFRILRYVFQ